MDEILEGMESIEELLERLDEEKRIRDAQEASN